VGQDFALIVKKRLRFDLEHFFATSLNPSASFSGNLDS
jgi:hypothetical protein